MSITDTLPEVSLPTHSRLPSGVRATLTGSPETAIVLVTCALVSGSRGNRPNPVVPSAVVKSPTVWRRQAVMLGLTTPVTCSSSWVTEVWSNVSWQT